MTRALTVAVPKGRLAKQLAASLAQAGVPAGALAETDRTLVREAIVDGTPMRFLLLKPDDVPTYVEHGACDLGVVGRDVLLEREADLVLPHDTGLGRCRMVVAAPEAWTAPPRDRALRVATKYPRIARRHFAAQGTEVEVIFVQGSVETAPLVGLSDVIVDLVETGETLRQNGLCVVAEVCAVSAVVVVNRVVFKLHRAAIERFIGRLPSA